MTSQKHSECVFERISILLFNVQWDLQFQRVDTHFRAPTPTHIPPAECAPSRYTCITIYFLKNSKLVNYILLFTKDIWTVVFCEGNRVFHGSEGDRRSSERSLSLLPVLSLCKRGEYYVTVQDIKLEAYCVHRFRARRPAPRPGS
jgi:hypothetical protein